MSTLKSADVEVRGPGKAPYVSSWKILGSVSAVWQGGVETRAKGEAERHLIAVKIGRQA